MAISQDLETPATRVLFFLPDLDGGGAQRTMVNIVNRLPREKFDPTLAVARADGPARQWLDPEVKLVDLGTERLRRSVLPLRGLIRRRRPAAVIATIVDANIAAAMATAGLASKPALVLRETNSHRARDDLGAIRRTLAGWAYRRADAVVALSSGVEAELAADFGLDAGHVTTISNPVDVEAVRARASAAPTAAAATESRGEPTLIAVGRLHRQKGFDVLIRALAMLKNPKVRLIVLGEGAERDALGGLAAELGVAERVSFAGFVDDPYTWLARADLFVLSSRWEGFGHVIVEAMAAGTPVVATNCPHGPGDIIDDGKNGRLVPPEDATALAAAIDDLIADPSARTRLAAHAAATVSRFGIARIVDQYTALLDRVTANSDNRRP